MLTKKFKLPARGIKKLKPEESLVQTPCLMTRVTILPENDLGRDLCFEYGLVRKDEIGEVTFSVWSITTRSSGGELQPFRLPFRQLAATQVDMISFNLPHFILHKKKVQETKLSQKNCSGFAMRLLGSDRYKALPETVSEELDM